MDTWLPILLLRREFARRGIHPVLGFAILAIAIAISFSVAIFLNSDD
jgi:hypothetical protein